MTDKDKLKELLEEFGVGFTEEEGDIVLEVGNAKVGGYVSAITYFFFDKNNDDKFTKIEMGEV